MALPANLATNLAVGDPLPSALNETRAAVNTLKGEVINKISQPAGLAVGDTLIWDGDKWISSITRHLEGNGSPEGNVAAPVGSRYYDKTGAEGAVEYLKVSGGESTAGWLVKTGDTGRRNIASLIATPAGAAVNSAFVRRVGEVVDMYLDLTMPNTATANWTLFDALAGFGPGYLRLSALQDNNESANTGGTQVTATGGVNILKTVGGGGKRDRYSGTWLTNANWPTSLPGTAA